VVLILLHSLRTNLSYNTNNMDLLASVACIRLIEQSEGAPTTANSLSSLLPPPSSRCDVENVRLGSVSNPH